jgi:hypothetical protein
VTTSTAVFAKVAPWLVLVLLVAAGVGGATIWAVTHPVSVTAESLPPPRPTRVLRRSARTAQRRRRDRYPCASGRDHARGTGWWHALLSYNTTEYAQLAYSAVLRRGQASLRGSRRRAVVP